MRPRRPLRPFPSKAEIVLGHVVLPATSSQETRRIGSRNRPSSHRNSTRERAMPVHKGLQVGKLDPLMSSPYAPESSPSDEHYDPVSMEDEAPEGVTVERAAQIEAYLAVCTDEPREELLGRFDIDEERWGNARKIWAERIEDEVLRASAPGQRVPMEDKYRLSMRYSIAYSKAAERAREDLVSPQAQAQKQEQEVPPLRTSGTALGSNQVLRLGSTHG
jgi:hypothetical protein